MTPQQALNDPGEKDIIKGAYTGHILQLFLLLIYCHVYYIYYLDNSIFGIIIRVSVQLTCFLPAQYFDSRVAPLRSSIISVIGSNGFCILRHLLEERPLAGEASRGYLRGSIVIDFIGQKTPVSKFRLISVDSIIMGLQLALLAISMSLHESQIVSQQTIEMEESGLHASIVDSAPNNESVAANINVLENLRSIWVEEPPTGTAESNGLTQRYASYLWDT